MRYVLGLFGLAVVGIVLVFALDPSYQRMRQDEAFYKASQQSLDLDRQRLELDERRAVSPVAVGTDGATRVLVPVGMLAALVALGDWYYNRRVPLVKPDSRGLLPVERRQVGQDDIKHLVTSAILAYHDTQTARAIHQPGQSPTSYAPHTSTSYAPSSSRALHYAPHTSGPAAQLPPADEEPSPDLPESPSWAELRRTWSPAPERMLLAYGADGPLYGSINDLLSTAIAGRPNQGKSTLLRFIFAQMQSIESESLIWDLHGSIAGDLPGVRACEDVEAIEQSAAHVIRMLEARIKSKAATPLLLLVDEWPVLSLASRKAGAAVSRVVLEGRKYGMYALIAGQGLPADRFGGSLVRDALSSRYVFRTTAAQARMAGLEGDARNLVTTLQPGRAVLAGPVDPQIVAIPNVTLADLGEFAARQTEPAELKSSALECDDSQIRLVQQLRASGRNKNEILELVWSAKPGGSRVYKQASAAYDAIVGGAL